MRLLALMIAAVLWGAPALAEGKAAPDGFGPIKFGMGLEEALEAVEWQATLKDGAVVYATEIAFQYDTLTKLKATVEHKMSPAGAGDVTISFDELLAGELWCVVTSQRFASLIQLEYERSPMFSGIWRDEDDKSTNGTYTFSFQNGTMIVVKVRTELTEGRLSPPVKSCYLTVNFYPWPEENAFPF